MAAFAGEIPHVAIEGLAVAAARAHRVREREVPAEPLEFPRLAAHEAPSFGWMVADFEKPPVHRNVAPIDVQYDDLTRRNADDRVPRSPAEEVRASFSDARPAPGLESGGPYGTRWIRHPYKLADGGSRVRDAGHTRLIRTPNSRRRGTWRSPQRRRAGSRNRDRRRGTHGRHRDCASPAPPPLPRTRR